MQHRDQEVLIDVSTAAMDTGGYGVLLTVTAEGGTEVDAAFSPATAPRWTRHVIARNCSRRTGSRKTSSPARKPCRREFVAVSVCVVMALGRGAVKRMQRKFRLSSLLHNMRLRWSPRRSKMAAAQTNSTLAARAFRFSDPAHGWDRASTRRSGYPSNHWMPLPGIRCPPNVIARWRARASSTYAEASGADAAAHADRLFESLCAHFQDARRLATAWTRRRVRWTRPRISIPTPSSCSPAPRISGARAMPRRASSCWARRKPSRLASSGPTALYEAAVA